MKKKKENKNEGGGGRGGAAQKVKYIRVRDFYFILFYSRGVGRGSEEKNNLNPHSTRTDWLKSNQYP